MRLFTKKSCYYQGFFAVKRRAVFILGAKWKALARGWRKDCVVGGMETRFQWRKAHSRTAKCEAFHVAPRRFFYVFVFDSIDDSATIHNLSPGIFHWTIKWLNRLWADVNYLIFTLDCSMMGAKWVGEDFMESDNFINFEKSEYSILLITILSIIKLYINNSSTWKWKVSSIQ